MVPRKKKGGEFLDVLKVGNRGRQRSKTEGSSYSVDKRNIEDSQKRIMTKKRTTPGGLSDRTLNTSQRKGVLTGKKKARLAFLKKPCGSKGPVEFTTARFQ